MEDILYMKEALAEAQIAYECGEIPIGAVMVHNNEIIGRGHNSRAVSGSPLGHAEMGAMREAAEKLKSWRFDNCTLYVTLEPCAMCAGAVVQCRLGSLIYGAKDPKAGAVGSLYNIPDDPRMYHRCKVRSGILKSECAEILQRFFREKRKNRL